MSPPIRRPDIRPPQTINWPKTKIHFHFKIPAETKSFFFTKYLEHGRRRFLLFGSSAALLCPICCCPSGCAKASDDWPTGTTPFYIICPSFFFFFFLLLGSHQKEKKNRDETSQRESRMDGPVMTGRIRQDDDSPNTKLKFIVCLLYAMPPIVIPLAIDLHPSRNKHHATSITGCRLTN